MNKLRECLPTFLDVLDAVIRRVDEIEFLVALGEFGCELIAFVLEVHFLLHKARRIGEAARQTRRGAWLPE